MSLFDVIKYPISDPVLPGQITSLPKNILINEIDRVAYEGYTDAVPVDFSIKHVEMCIIECGSWSGENGSITVQTLRNALKEYYEPV